MSETTTITSTEVDQNARFRAFTALGLALTALWGGGVVSAVFQWLLIRAFSGISGDQLYWAANSAGPLLMGFVALYLAITVSRSDDVLARPLARAAVVLSGVALVASVLLMMVTVGEV